MSDDWLISYGHPYEESKVLFRYISAEDFDDAVQQGKKEWTALCAAYERQVGSYAPSCELLMVAYDPEHKIGGGGGIRIGDDDDESS